MKTQELPDVKKLNVIFQINEGAKIVVSSIAFDGNIVFKSNKLKRIISTKTSSIIRKGTFSESLLEDDKDLIGQEYQKKGYIDALVVDILIEKKTK